MILRTGYLFLMLFVIAACANNNSENTSTDFISSETSSDEFKTSSEKPYSIVGGLLFKVNDFDAWEKDYLGNAHNTIIYLRSVDDPNIVVLFEGNESYSDALNRVSDVMDMAFTEASGVERKPVISYYNIRYFEPKDGVSSQFLALSFNVAGEASWLKIGEDRIEQLANYGLTPLGMGSNYSNPENIYILLAVEDLAQFRDNISSHREIKNFLKTLNFPDNTGLSFWQKP